MLRSPLLLQPVAQQFSTSTNALASRIKISQGGGGRLVVSPCRRRLAGAGRRLALAPLDPAGRHCTALALAAARLVQDGGLRCTAPFCEEPL